MYRIVHCLAILTVHHVDSLIQLHPDAPCSFTRGRFERRVQPLVRVRSVRLLSRATARQIPSFVSLRALRGEISSASFPCEGQYPSAENCSLRMNAKNCYPVLNHAEFSLKFLIHHHGRRPHFQSLFTGHCLLFTDLNSSPQNPVQRVMSELFDVKLNSLEFNR